MKTLKLNMSETSKRIKKIILRIFLVVFFLYAALCGAMYYFQKKIIFHPTKQVVLPKSSTVENVYFSTSDAESLNGWFVNNKGRKTVLFFHGNSRNISDLDGRLKVFKELGFNAFVFDYRGYGNSSGGVGEEADFYDDAAAAYTYLVKERKIPPQDIIIWGHSLGGAIAVDTAQQKKVSAVVIESTFLSMDKLGQEKVPFVPVRLLSRFHFLSDQKLQHIQAPLLIVHSDDDTLVPPHHGKGLYSLAPSPKSFLTINGPHDNAYELSRTAYMAELKKFFAK